MRESVLGRILENKKREIESLVVSTRERNKPVLDFRQAVIDRHFICEVKKRPHPRLVLLTVMPM